MTKQYEIFQWSAWKQDIVAVGVRDRPGREYGTLLPVDIIIYNYAFRQVRPSGCKMKLTTTAKKRQNN